MAAASDRTQSAEPKANIFISYSRRDTAFVDRLEAALRARGFEPFIDRQDPVALQDWSKGIAPFENWWNEIKRMIASADTVVFVISPNSIASKYCQDELAEAGKFNKRVAPILYRPVNDAALPEALGRLQRVSFEDDQNFAASVVRLAAGLETNIDWIRKHSEIAVTAQRWDAIGRPGRHGLLLRPPPLNEWEAWLGSRPRRVPEPTEAARAYIAASRQGYDEEQAAIATSQVNLLAQVGDGERLRGNTETALRLCVYAARRNLEVQRQSAGSSAAAAALAAAACQTRLRLMLSGHEKGVISAAFSPDGTRIVTGSLDKTARIWNAATGQAILVLRDEDIVSSAAFSPDGKYILTGAMSSGASSVRIWDTVTGRQLATFCGREGTINSAAFSSDGRRVITSSYGGTARIWDIASRKELAALRANDKELHCADFSPDGSRIVTASEDGSARIWNAFTAEAVAVLYGHKLDVKSAAFSPDGARIVTASRDADVRIWDAATGGEIKILRGHEKCVNSAAFSPDGNRIVTASDDWTARIWEAATGKEVTVLRGHEKDVKSATFSPDGGSHIVTASDDSTARLWDVATGKEIGVLRGHKKVYRASAAFSPDGSRIVTASYDNTARVWDSTATAGTEISRIRAGKNRTFITSADNKLQRDWELRMLKEMAGLSGDETDGIDQVNSAAFSPDGQRIVTASDDKTARMWDAASGKEITVLRGHEDRVNSAVFSPDGRRIVTASDDGTARIWNSNSGKRIATLEPHWARVNFAAFSLDGLRIVTATGNRGAKLRYNVHIWDANSYNEIAVLYGGGSYPFTMFEPPKPVDPAIPWVGKEITVYEGHEGDVNSAGFSPDGTQMVTASDDGTARIWDAQNGKPIAVMRGHEDVVNTAAFSPTGMEIVTASTDGTARLWNAVTGHEIAVLHGHEAFVRSAVFSPDGRRIVTASGDSTARIWDAESGREIAILSGHDGVVKSSAFGPDGTRILTASEDGTVRIWDVHFATMSAHDLIVEVCMRRLQGLTMLSRDEMRLAGYPNDMPEIDVAEG